MTDGRANYVYIIGRGKYAVVFADSLFNPFSPYDPCRTIIIYVREQTFGQCSGGHDVREFNVLRRQ